MHGPHESLPGYHPDQLLVDGCDECEERGCLLVRHTCLLCLPHGGHKASKSPVQVIA